MSGLSEDDLRALIEREVAHVDRQHLRETADFMREILKAHRHVVIDAPSLHPLVLDVTDDLRVGLQGATRSDLIEYAGRKYDESAAATEAAGGAMLLAKLLADRVAPTVGDLVATDVESA